MENNRTVTDATIAEAVTSLVEMSRIDTLYGDLYLRRAGEMLQNRMSLAAYRGMQRMETELKNLPNRIHNAMMQNKWLEVEELSGQMESLKQSVAQNQALLSLAKTVYERDAIPIDPFSPGMQAIAGTSMKELPAIRNKGLLNLATLLRLDNGWQEFYTERRNDLQAQAMVPAATTPDESRPSAANLRQEAMEALAQGNFAKLRQLAGTLSGAGTTGAVDTGPLPPEGKTGAMGENLDFAFSEAVLGSARSLGLAAVRVSARYREYTCLTPSLWHPTFAELGGEQERATRLSELPLPADTPQALRGRIEMFVLHPFVNSAGVRFFPPLADEDVLVEDFPEPGANSAMPGSGLLEALGLGRRNGLTRMKIEEALAERGYDIVRDLLGLDPFAFRLVCIPPDVHLQVGIDRGWGTEEIWTHFDGYMLSGDGKLQALAGGDVRFGGIYDMVGISRNYESDRIVARFAVVQRRRMARRLI